MSPFTFRPMEGPDIPLLAGWLAELPLLQRYGLSTERAQEALNQALRKLDTLSVCDPTESPGHACGLAWVMPTGGFGRSAYLRLLAVSGEHAGLGIGSALLAHAEQLASGLSQDMLLLVSDFNTDAQQFYRRHGYVQIGALPGYVLPDVTELLFRKLLH